MAVERDHRHISRILGLMWKDLPDDTKAFYHALAEEEKFQHAKRYPGYQFTPTTRVKKPVKRNVRRNEKKDLLRDAKIVEVLRAGKGVDDLKRKVKDFDMQSPTSCDARTPSKADPFIPDLGASVSQISKPGVVQGWSPPPLPVLEPPPFRSPLMAPEPLPPSMDYQESYAADPVSYPHRYSNQPIDAVQAYYTADHMGGGFESLDPYGYTDFSYLDSPSPLDLPNLEQPAFSSWNGSEPLPNMFNFPPDHSFSDYSNGPLGHFNLQQFQTGFGYS